MTKNLNDKYLINTRYQRSARIDTDWKNDIVSGYVLHNTARSVVTRIAEQISDQTKPQKAFMKKLVDDNIHTIEKLISQIIDNM